MTEYKHCGGCGYERLIGEDGSEAIMPCRCNGSLMSTLPAPTGLLTGEPPAQENEPAICFVNYGTIPE